MRALVNQSTDSNGRTKEVKNFFDEATSLFGGFGAKKPWTQVIIDVGFPGVNEEGLAPVACLRLHQILPQAGRG